MAVPGLDMASFRECLKRQLSVGAVVRDREMGKRVGVVGTPAVFLNGIQIPGVRSGAELYKYLSDASKKNREEPSQ